MSSSADGTTTAFISGIFNVLHPGHIRLFKLAAEQADRLVVGLRTKQPSDNGMVLSDDDRLQALQLVSLIDEILLMDDLEVTLEQVKPDIVLKGREFREQENPEAALLAKWGGKLLFSSGESQVNSLKFVQQTAPAPEIELSGAYRRYIQRHDINSQALQQGLSQAKALKVAVVGDTILDQYIDCDPVGLSREDPTIVVTPTEKNLFIGGAAIVALHAHAFGAKVDFYSVCGVDARADWLETELLTSGINAHLYKDKSRPTTLKRRYRTQNKTLLRVNEYRSHSLEQSVQSQILQDFEARIGEYDLIIFSDFSYGLLNADLVSQMQDIAKRHNVAMVADSQTSSQRGDLSKFKHLLLATPTEIEARLATDITDNDVGLAVVIEHIAQQLNAQNMMITLGEEGALILDFSNPQKPRLDSLPALNKNPVDVSGAGDLLLVCSALLMRAGCDLWHASLLASIASALHISVVGNRPIAIAQLQQLLEKV